MPHKKNSYIATKRPLELVHMDLMGPIQTRSTNGKKYIFVCVDDYSRFTWVYFLRKKTEAFDYFKKFVIKFKMKKVLISRKYVALGVIMGQNLKMLNLVSFVMVWGFHMSSRHLELLNKMELLREKIMSCKR